MIVELQGCVIVALQGCVIVALQGCINVALQGCVIVMLQDLLLKTFLNQIALNPIIFLHCDNFSPIFRKLDDQIACIFFMLFKYLLCQPE
jgi:hypothetical protein